MDSIDKLALTCKQLYDVRIIDQRQEIERLKDQLQKCDDRIIKMWKKSDLAYYFQIPLEFFRFANEKVYNGVKLKFDKWNHHISKYDDYYLWYAHESDINSEYPHLWYFPSIEVRDIYIKALRDALVSWKENPRNDRNDLGEITFIK